MDSSQRQNEGGNSALDPYSVLDSLEPDQVVAQRRPLSRRNLKASEVLVFWLLRLYLVFMMGILVYQVWSGLK